MEIKFLFLKFRSESVTKKLAQISPMKTLFDASLLKNGVICEFNWQQNIDRHF